MEGYDYFRKSVQRFRPRTPATAFKALEAQILPGEAFTHLGTSIRSIAEEPVDLEEIERVLAREDLDIDTNLLLVRVLERLVRNRDPETALLPPRAST